MCSSCDYGVALHRERGAYRIEDEEEARHRPKRGKTSPRKKPGCVANQGKNHVYAWIEYHARWKDHPFGLTGESRWHESTWWEQECVGCGKINNRRYSYFNDYTADGIEVYEVRQANHPWYY